MPPHFSSSINFLSYTKPLNSIWNLEINIMPKLFDTNISFKTLIKKDIETVFDLISSSKGWDAWFTHGSVFEIGEKKCYLSWKNWGAEQVSFKDKVEILTIETLKLCVD